MKLSLASAIAILSLSGPIAAQSFSDCNPLGKTCPPVSAFGKSETFDFTSGKQPGFSETQSPTYDSNGIGFTVSQQGDAPLINSNWYIMFGHVEFELKAAPGKGIVSSAVLQSDDLDEIDWEWLGGNNALCQSNYFGKGKTTTYNRGATHDDPGNHDDFHTYTIDWTKEQIVWQIDGETVRVLTPDTAADDQYPQTPMMIRVGVWAGGDPDNAQGTIDWAGGLTDYGAGPYTMYLKSLKVTDYSTGSTYSYGDQSGSWESIHADGGKVNGNSAAESMTSVQSAPQVTATVANAPIPFKGTHRETSSFVTPDIWPWVPKPTSSTSQQPLPSLPNGWTYDSGSSGSVQPPGAACSTFLSTSVWSLSVLASPSSGREEGSTVPLVGASSTGVSSEIASTSGVSMTSSASTASSTTASAPNQSSFAASTTTPSISTTSSSASSTTSMSTTSPETSQTPTPTPSETPTNANTANTTPSHSDFNSTATTASDTHDDNNTRPTSTSSTTTSTTTSNSNTNDHAAPTVDAAHRPLDVPLAMTALFVFLGSAMVML